MNVSHPYWAVYALAIGIVALSITAYYSAKAWQVIDDVLETRRNRRLEHRAATEEIRQRLQAAADRINNSGLE